MCTPNQYLHTCVVKSVRYATVAPQEGDKTIMSKRILGALGGLLAISIVGLLLFTRRHTAPNEKRLQQILQQGQMLGIAVLKYEDHHDERLPSGANWEAEIRPYLPDKNFSYLLPASADGKPHRWVLERTVAGHKLEDLRSPLWERVVFFEAQASQNSATGTLALMSKSGGEEGFVVVYASRLSEYIPASRKSTFLLQNERPLVTP